MSCYHVGRCQGRRIVMQHTETPESFCRGPSMYVLALGLYQNWEVPKVYRQTFLRIVQLLSMFYFGTDGTILCFVYGGVEITLFVCLFD
jgi:hypothetical protein